MWIAIAYRNPLGSVFKGFAEFFTLFGLIVAKMLLKKKSFDWKVAAPTYIIFGVAFRAVGMYISNIFLVQWLYGSPPDVAIVLSATFVIPNVIQALLNVLIGILIFIVIPENLAIQARLGKYGSESSQQYEEISDEELDIVNDES
jgi:hypothetical protein